MPSLPVTGWPVPETCPQLVPGEIQLWTACLDDPALGESNDLLSSDELARARAYHFDRDRRRFMSGRVVLRRLLAALLGKEAGALVFNYGAFGKPEIASSGVHFNVSHSDALAAFAFSRDYPVGIDVEGIRPMDDLAMMEETVFPVAELDAQQSRTRGDRERHFFSRWTEREAVGKCAGVGLFLEQGRGVAVTPATVNTARLDFGEAYVGTIAWAGGTAVLRRCRYDPRMGQITAYPAFTSGP